MRDGRGVGLRSTADYITDHSLKLEAELIGQIAKLSRTMTYSIFCAECWLAFVLACIFRPSLRKSSDCVERHAGASPVRALFLPELGMQRVDADAAVAATHAHCAARDLGVANDEHVACTLLHGRTHASR